MSIRRGLALIFSILVLGGLAFALWPTRFGGQALFVVVRGESMKPTYQQGELLYARKSNKYKAGDIAIYRIPNGEPGQGTLVVHRIKRVLPDGTYLFQGDNKNDPDDATPNRAHLVGKPIADLGDVPTRALILLPVLLTLLAGIAVTFALWPDQRVETRAEADPDDEDKAEAPQPAFTFSARSSAAAPLATHSGPADAARDIVSSSTP